MDVTICRNCTPFGPGTRRTPFTGAVLARAAIRRNGRLCAPDSAAGLVLSVAGRPCVCQPCVLKMLHGRRYVGKTNIRYSRRHSHSVQNASVTARRAAGRWAYSRHSFTMITMNCLNLYNIYVHKTGTQIQIRIGSVATKRHPQLHQPIGNTGSCLQWSARWSSRL